MTPSVITPSAAALALTTTEEITDLADPKLRQVAMRVLKEMELAIQKAVAHEADPATYPLPAEQDAVERLVHARAQTLKPEQRRLAVAKVMPRVMAAPAQQAQALGDLAKINLRAPTSVAKQADALPFPASLKLQANALQPLASFASAATVAASSAGVAVAAIASVTDKLELRLHRVKCVDETGSGTFGELGKDEIALSGTAVDETGDIHKLTEFKVGDFNDGDVRTFSPPRRLTSFDLREGTAFPKSYFVTLVLAEKDLGGGLADFVSRLLEKVRERVIAYLAAAIGGAIGTSGGPVGAAIGAAVGFVIGKVFELIKALFADDIFPPKTISAAIGSLSHRFAGGQVDSPDAVLTFVGHSGTYQLTYDWRVFA